MPVESRAGILARAVWWGVGVGGEWTGRGPISHGREITGDS